MTKLIYKVSSPLLFSFNLLLLSLFSYSTNAQCTLACNDNVQVSVSTDNFVNSGIVDPCSVYLNIDMLLEAPGLIFQPGGCNAAYARIVVKYGSQTVFTSQQLTSINMMDHFDGSNYLGNNLSTEVHVYNAQDQRINYCWGSMFLEDKHAPEFICPTTPYVLDCTEDLNGVPVPVAYDNCDGNPQVDLVNEQIVGDICSGMLINRTYRATDYSGNVSSDCMITIQVTQADLKFPDDITWTCEQYHAYPNIIDPIALHPCLLDNAAAMDLQNLYCVPGTDGDDMANRDPYDMSVDYWRDQEDLDVTLDPKYDDNIDNPITDFSPNRFESNGDPIFATIGTPSAETDEYDFCNLSMFVGCPYLDTFIDNSTHWPDTFIVPRYLPINGQGLPVRGLEDADVLELTGSGVTNVHGSSCNYAITYQDEVVDVCHSSGSFKILRTWKVSEWCTGALITDLQVITVMDKSKPTIAFPNNFNKVLVATQTLSHSHYNCGSDGLLDVPDIKDNCSGIEEVKALIPGVGTVPVYSGTELIGFRILPPYLDLGEHDVTYKVTDACGNEARATIKIKVIDGIPPIPICREFTQVALSTGGAANSAVVGAEYFDEGSYDYCEDVHFKVRRMDSYCGSFQTDQTHFNDNIHFCCEDIGDTINVILRIYDIDPPSGPVNQNYGIYEEDGVPYFHFNDCMIRVLVEDKVLPVCDPPQDRWTTCESIPDNVDLHDVNELQRLFGVPNTGDNCGAGFTELAPDVDVDVCGVGQITRRFRALDNYGNYSIGTCRQTITIGAVNDYYLDLPGDFEGECGPHSAEDLDHTDLGCDLLAVSVEEEYFDASQLGDGNCYKIIRTYQIVNWCEYDGFSDPTILPRIDADNNGFIGDAYKVVSNGDFLHYSSASVGNRMYTNAVTSGPYATANGTFNPESRSWGYYEYKQVIKVADTQAPSLADTINTPFCGGEIDEPICTGLIDVAPEVFEACTPDDLTYNWQLDLDDDGQYEHSGTGSLQGRYPLGSHRAHFAVLDDCGNTSEVDVYFEIIDCKNPTPICINGLSTSLMNTGLVEIWASDFDASSFDYCHDLEFRVNRFDDVNGDGLIDSDDHLTSVPSSSSVLFSCADTGIVHIQLWVGEANGDGVNDWDYCTTFVDVQDNLNVCTGSRISGTVKTENNEGVKDVSLDLSGSNPQTALTDENGFYTFAVEEGEDYSLIASKQGDYRNGVSTLDIALIAKHILNVQRLDSPYKVIAADANNSGSVSTLDLLGLRKLVLRVADDLPNSPSWRFIEKDYVFPNVLDPWSSNIPFLTNLNNVSGQKIFDFIGIKMGDVNGSAKVNDFASVEDRSFSEYVVFDLRDQSFEKDETVQVNFSSAELNKLGGFQFTMEYDASLLDLESITHGITNDENFNLSHSAVGIITCSWNGNVDGPHAFGLVFKTKESGNLSKSVSITSSKTPAEAYNLELTELKGLKLNFISDLSDNVRFRLLPNHPNPFSEETTIRFELPRAESATITITDVQGKILKQIEGDFAKGLNEINFKKTALIREGVLIYQVQTANSAASRKMIITD